MRISRSKWLLAAAVACATSASSAADSLFTFYQPQKSETPFQTVSLAEGTSNVQVSYAEANTGCADSACGCTSAAGSCGNGCSSGCGCNSCCDPCWTNTTCGPLFESQIFAARAHTSEGPSGNKYDIGSRTTLGYMGCSGNSVRMRYFQYGSVLGSNRNENLTKFDMAYMDLEYAQRFCLGSCLRAELSGGVRWLEAAETNRNLDYHQTGGIVLGAMVYGPSIRCWDLYASARYSQQFGTAVPTGGGGKFNGTFTFTEMQLGAQRNFQMGCGTAFVKTFIESDYLAGFEGFDTQDLGIIGTGFSIGFMR